MKTYQVLVSENKLNLLTLFRSKLADFYKENHFLYLTMDNKSDILVLTSIYPTQNPFFLNDSYEGPRWFIDFQELQDITIIEEQEKLE